MTDLLTATDPETMTMDLMALVLILGGVVGGVGGLIYFLLR